MLKRVILGVVILAISGLAFADVPVVDYSADTDSAAVTQPEKYNNAATFTDSTLKENSRLSTEQRLNKLEHQIQNLNQQDAGAKIEELQQHLQKLDGAVETQTHQIAQLQEQLRSYYQDLNARITQGKDGKKPIGVVKPAGVAMQSSPTVAASTLAPAAAGITPATVDTTTPDNTQPVAATTVSDTSGVMPVATDLKSSQHDSDTAFLQEQQMYQTAIDLLPDKKFDAGAKKLHEYLVKYPQGVYVSQAHYWLGEINFLQKNYDTAAVEFKTVVTKYPTSKKAADAMFKLALVHLNQGKTIDAKIELKQVIKRFPTTSAAQLAKQQLEGL